MDLFFRIDMNIVAIILVTYILSIAYKRLDKSDKANQLFLNMGFLIIAELINEVLACIINGRPEKWLIPVADVLYVCLFIGGPLLTYLWCMFIYVWIVPNYSLILKKTKLLIVPFICNLSVAILSPATGWFFRISDANVYLRGPIYLLSIFIGYYYLFYGIYVIFKHKKELMKDVYTPLLMFGIFPAVGGIIQSFLYGTMLLWSTAAFSLVIIFIFIQQQMMQFDTLTGAWTKGSLEYYIERKIKKEKEYAEFGIIFVDIDGLKQINDNYGHLEGDFALRKSVSLLKNSVRKTDIVARFGGDEFIVILEKITEKEIDDIVKRMNEIFTSYNEASDKNYNLEYSIGYEVFDPKKHNINQFINYVDHLMYVNKEDKRARVNV